MEHNKNIPDTELIYGTNCPYIDIQWKKGRIFVSNAVFRLIGNPSGIRLQWNAAKRILIVEPTDIDNLYAFPVRGKKYKQHIDSATLIHEIWSTSDWNKMQCFKVVAKYNKISNIAIFDMKEAVAVEIKRDIFVEVG